MIYDNSDSIFIETYESENHNSESYDKKRQLTNIVIS